MARNVMQNLHRRLTFSYTFMIIVVVIFTTVTLPSAKANPAIENAVLSREPTKFPPLSEASSPEYANGSPIPVISQVTFDGYSGLDFVRLHYRFNDNDWTSTDYVSSNMYDTFNFVPLDGEGTYYFQTIATDHDGDIERGPSGDGDSITIYDTSSPTSDANSNMYDITSPIAIDFNTNDTGGSGIKTVKLHFQYNSEGWQDTELASSSSSGTFNFNPSDGDGYYNFQTIATDNAGNVETGPSGSGDSTTIFDTTSPESSAIPPTTTQSTPITVNFVAEDVTSDVFETCLWIKENDNPWQNSNLCESGTSGDFSVDGIQEGTFCFQTIAVDNAGNSEEAASGNGDACTDFDKTAPESHAISQDYENGENIPVNWNSSDNVSGLDVTCLWYKPLSGVWTDTGTCQSGESGTFYQSPTGNEGEYCFQTVAVDNAGNTEKTPSGADPGDDCTIYDTIAPTSSAVSPDYTKDSPISIDWIAFDTTSSLDETCLFFKPPSGDWIDANTCQTDTGGTFYFDPNDGEGNYCFQTVAQDNAGNSEAAASGDGDDCTMYDTIKPTANINHPADQSTIFRLYFDVNWSGVDPTPGSGIGSYQVQYAVKGGEWTDWYTSTELTTAQFGPDSPVTVNKDYNYSFQVRSTDNAGNQSVYSDEITVFVKNNRIYLPHVSNNFSSFTNGSFEYGWSGWRHGGELAQYISTDDTHSESSDYSALLGSDKDYECDRVPAGSAWLEQTFTIPSNGINSIIIWYRIYSRDESFENEYDRFEIWIDNELVKWDGDFDGKWGCNELSISNWKPYEYAIPESKKGGNIKVLLINKSQPDGGKGFTDFATWVYVDDIQLLP